MPRRRLTARILLFGSMMAAVVALTGPVPQAAGVTVSFPSMLAAGPDYATDVLGDAWDMCNPEDISPFPYEHVGFSTFGFATSPCRVGGQTQLVNGSADSTVTFLYRGIYGVVNPGRNGRTFPVDTSKYQILSYKLNSSLANEVPQIFWFHNSHSDPSGNNFGFRFGASTTGGTQIAVADLTQQLVFGTPWGSGSVAGLRIDPNSGNAGHSAFFHWVRLTTASGAVQAITWSGGSGPATITVRDNSDGTVSTVASGVSSPYNWNYGVLPPGSYTLTVTRGTFDGSASFTINHPPTIRVTDPSPSTGEDFATKVLGNPWDMSDSGDIQITGLEHTTTPTFGGGMVTATNVTNDPNLTLVYSSNNSIPIDTTKYRYLTYRFQVDGPFDLGLGSVARILWSSESIMTGSNGTATKDILVWPGMNSYTIDLATLSTGPDGGLEPSAGAQLWANSVKGNLRFDPHEFVEPRTFHLDDVKLTAKPVAAGFFTIRFAGGDADGNPTTVSLYYDHDTNAANGKTPIASGIAMSAGQFGWGTAGVPPGDYYIYAEANDGIQTTGRYSEAPVQVSAGEAGDRPGDFDGDAKSDITVFRPSSGIWLTLQSSANFTTWSVRQWALSGDLPQPGDYDGDGRTDIAVYRPSSGYWYILQSSTGSSTLMVQQWGLAGDVPTPGDYDGDGKTDMAVYRPSGGYWYVITSSTNYTGVIVKQWGLTGDVPQPGDYDGDGKTDMAVYRPSSGYWYVAKSSTNYTGVIVQQWGLTEDVPQPGDYDGDRKTDMAVYRPSSGYWYILRSSTTPSTVFVLQWGVTGDVPTPGDYDGDGRTDIAVYRPSSGHWFLLKSSTNYTTPSIYQWGLSGDVPVVQR